MRDTPFRDHRSWFLAGKFGVRLFLVSLGVLFAATLVAFAVVRVQLTDRGTWPIDLPPLPNLLWISTAIILLSSITVQWGIVGIRHNRPGQLRNGLMITLMLGLAFLLTQLRCWLLWLAPISQRWAESDEYRFALTSFYIFTVLHALHVVAGLVPMTIVTRRAVLGWYSHEFHAGPHYVALYWHFLAAVWIVLMAILQFAM